MKAWAVAFGKALGIILAGMSIMGIMLGIGAFVDFYLLKWLGLPTGEGLGLVVIVILVIFMVFVGTIHEDEVMKDEYRNKKE